MKNLTLAQKLIFVLITSFGLLFLALYTKPHWENIFNTTENFNPLSVDEILSLIEKEEVEKVAFLKARGMKETESGSIYFSNDLIGTSSGIVDYVSVNSDSSYAVLFGNIPNLKKKINRLTISYTDKALHENYLKKFKEKGFVFKQESEPSLLEASSAEMKNETDGFFLYTLKFGKYYTLTILNGKLNAIHQLSSLGNNPSLKEVMSEPSSNNDNSETETFQFYTEKGEIVELKAFEDNLQVEFPKMAFSQKIKIDMEATEVEGMGVYSGKIRFNGSYCELTVQFLEDDRCEISSPCSELNKGLCSSEKPIKEPENNPFGSGGNGTNGGFVTGNNEGSGIGQEPRKRITKLNLEHISVPESVLIDFKVNINRNGDVTSVYHLPSGMKVIDPVIIEELKSAIITQLKYEKSNEISSDRIKIELRKK